MKARNIKIKKILEDLQAEIEFDMNDLNTKFFNAFVKIVSVIERTE